jgi:hypothetical protein
MREQQLRAATSFFDNNNKYNTWLGLPQPTTKKRVAYQLDQIFIPRNQLCYTTDIKRKFDGATSDHAALSIHFQLPNGPLLKKKTPKEDAPPVQKTDNNILRNKQLQNFKNKVDEFFNNLSPEESLLLSPSDILDNFEKHIYQAAYDLAASECRKRPDWFTESEETLLEAIQDRNAAFKCFVKHPSETTRQNLREARHRLLRIKRIAKRKWQFEYASKCQKSDFCLKPKDAWNMVFKLMEGFTSHHKKYMPKNFKSKNGV